jgi:hypothetical protein
MEMPTRMDLPRDDRVTHGTEVLDDKAQEVSLTQLIPRIASNNRKANETVPTDLFFFQKIRAGRRCSCWTVEESPNSLCLACFGQGTVGGFVKFGTALEVIDVSRPGVRTANVIPDFGTKTKPFHFTLIDGAKFGFIEVDVPIGTPNPGRLDNFFEDSITKEGGALRTFIQSPADQEPIEFSETALQQRLVNSTIKFRVEFSRGTALTPSPRLGSMHIRYNRVEQLTVVGNVPRTAKSVMLEELGVFDDWQPQHFWLDNKIKSITTEDFFVQVDGETRWKVNSVQHFDPAGKLLSWDLDTRLIQDHEPFSRVPI